jgi:hypothetical protein
MASGHFPLFFFSFFLRFENQTLRAKFAVKFGIAAGHPLFKTLLAVSDLMLLAGE